MGLYDYVSLLLTGVGYLLLAYRSSFVLSQNPEVKASLLEPLGVKWIVFLLFTIFEPTLDTILDIIPFGSLALLAVKCMIVLPENTLATYIFKRIEKQMEKIEFEEYSSKLTIYTSRICKFVAVCCIKACKNLAIYVKADQLGEIYSSLDETLKTLQYKRAAVEARHEIGKSIYRRQLSNNSDLDETLNNVDPHQLDDSESPNKSNIRESEVMSRMSMYYGQKPQREGTTLKIIAKIMVTKPDKSQNIKAQYEDGEVSFNSGTKQVTLKSGVGRDRQDTLLEIKYVSKNMMVLELILGRGDSVVIKLQQEQNVLTWMKPVIEAVKTRD